MKLKYSKINIIPTFISVMDHKYKSLLQNIPTRHIIASIDDVTSIKLHLTRFRDVDIVNFFVLGKLTTIKSVLDNANSNKLFGRKYAWHVITQVLKLKNILWLTKLYLPKPKHKIDKL